MILSARQLSTLLRGFVICLSKAESRGPQIHARHPQLVENLPRGFVVNGARQQPCHGLRQSALHRRRILQRRGFKPSLARTLCLFSGAPRLRKAMGVAVPRSPHGGGPAAGGVVHPVLA
jgi:hypothetical protein